MAEAEIAKARGEYSEAGRLYGETMEKANRSVMAGGLQDNQSTIFGASARAHVRAGELDIAQGVIDQAFKRDGAEPGLWLARAMLQEANGAKHMALASVNYALAIWSEADPDYIHMREALDLQQRLEAAPD
jgi:tetratricopeptide (TPR) repeat protein